MGSRSCFDAVLLMDKVSGTVSDIVVVLSHIYFFFFKCKLFGFTMRVTSLATAAETNTTL